MTAQTTLSEIRQRLGAVAESIVQKLGQAAKNTPDLPADGVEKAKELGEKAEAIRAKLPESEDHTWTGVAGEVERDMHALEQDFGHWVRYLDRHFDEQKKKD